MITFLQLGSFYVNYEEIRFFEVVSASHIQITTKDSIFRKINIFGGGAVSGKADTVKADIAAPHDITARLTVASFDKVRKALLTKVRGT